MSFFEVTKVKDSEGNLISPAEEGSLTLLRRIFQILKPLSIVTGGGSNRLNVDVNAITTLPTLANVTTVGTVTTVSTVSSVANQAAMGSVPAFDLIRAMSRTGYANGPRANLVIT